MADKHFKRLKESRPRGYKPFPCSSQLSTNFILLINVKMPTIVGILTFISMINILYERPKAINFHIPCEKPFNVDDVKFEILLFPLTPMLMSPENEISIFLKS